MARKFWGLSLSPFENYVPSHTGTLTLTQATLSLNEHKPGNTQLKLVTKGEVYVLCTLSKHSAQQKLNFSLSEEMIDCTLLVTGANAISLTGQVYDDDDDDDDFQLDEDDMEDEDDSGMLQFRDPSDNRFLGGFELRHFGLGSPPLMPVYDDIDLRKEEKTLEDKSLHDNIVQGLINAMMNSGDRTQLKTAKTISKKWKQDHRRKIQRKLKT
ncbi:hypothetical protein BC941DRAFT_446018 [Chlamydoabsidia padenii]|nr:hypothetical protein BC941DRAFT_446018 [Chlamydoabsidia padenii]